jgi:hypothetical protein
MEVRRGIYAGLAQSSLSGIGFLWALYAQRDPDHTCTHRFPPWHDTRVDEPTIVGLHIVARLLREGGSLSCGRRSRVEQLDRAWNAYVHWRAAYL